MPNERMRSRKFRLAARAQDMYALKLRDAKTDEEKRSVEKKQYNYWKRLAVGEGCWECWM